MRERRDQATELRKQAEELARRKADQLPENQKAVSQEDIRRLYHELQVHQIELELQNEELRQAQTQLDISQARYFDLYDLAPVGYFTLSEAGLILEMNLTACSQLDKAKGPLIKQRFSCLILSEDQEIFFRHRKLLFETGAPQTYELRLMKKDAAPFWVRIDSALARDTDNMPICRATMIDVNDRKIMDSARDFLAKYSGSAQDEGFFELLARYLAETLNMDFVCIDRLEGDGLTARTVAVWCDGKFEDNVSYALKDTPCGDVVGKSVCCFPANVCQFFPRDQVLQDLRADSYVGVTLWDHTGKPIGLIAVIGRQPLANRPLAEDIMKLVAVRAAGEMERMDAEEVLGKSEELFRTLTSMAPVGIYLTSPEGYCEYVNPCWCEMAGIDLQEALGDGWIKGLHPEDRSLVFSKWQQMAQSEGRWGMEYRFQTPEKKTTWVYGLATPVRDDSGRIIKYIGINTDITERKQAEKEKERLQDQLLQSQKMESVGRLAGGVAHDFNNMLGVILGHAEMAMEEVDPAQPLHADLAEIRKAANRSTDLTRQLLAFARKQTVSPRVLDLNETVEGMLKMLRRLIGEDINLAWHPGANTWPVKMDPSQIDQILANLSVNARDAISGVGKVTIETQNVHCDEAYCVDHTGCIPGDYVLLAVSDNGCGMDKETQSKLFEPFFTTKGIGKGTGLGLATVYGIVRQNNGFIDVCSEPGQGTTLKIYLPRHIGKVEKTQMEGLLEVAEPGHETILLVEDEPSLLELGKFMLEKQGYRVLPAATPGEAIRLAEECPEEIHLLMTDVVMPEMNGRELARKILSLYPKMKRLFMSGYTADVIAHHGVLDEGVHFLQKPFSKAALAAKVRAALEGVA